MLIRVLYVDLLSEVKNVELMSEGVVRWETYTLCIKRVVEGDQERFGPRGWRHSEMSLL